MNIIISPRAEKELRKMPKIDQIAIAKKIRSLKGPFTIKNNEKLTGYKNIYRIRISQYRILFKYKTNEIYIILIGHRKDIYHLISQLLR